MAKKGINKGLQTYNIIRTKLSEAGKEHDAPLGKELNKEASLLYTEYKELGLTIHNIDDLIEERFSLEKNIDWWLLKEDVNLNVEDPDSKVKIDTTAIGESGGVEIIKKSDLGYSSILSRITREVRSVTKNKSGVRFKVERDSNGDVSYTLRADDPNWSPTDQPTPFVKEQAKSPEDDKFDSEKYRIDKEFEERERESDKQRELLERLFEKGKITFDKLQDALKDLRK